MAASTPPSINNDEKRKHIASISNMRLFDNFDNYGVFILLLLGGCALLLILMLIISLFSMKNEVGGSVILNQNQLPTQ